MTPAHENLLFGECPCSWRLFLALSSIPDDQLDPDLVVCRDGLSKLVSWCRSRGFDPMPPPPTVRGGKVKPPIG